MNDTKPTFQRMVKFNLIEFELWSSKGRAIMLRYGTGTRRIRIHQYPDVLEFLLNRYTRVAYSVPEIPGSN